MDLYDLAVGKTVNKRWYVVAQLGEGSCGVVYRVYDIANPKLRAALKVEAITEDNPGILKKEAAVLKSLGLRKHVPQLINSGKRDHYTYIVLPLYGKNLNQLKKDKNLARLSPACAAKVGVQILYAIKQVHEIGFVHRDVKPTNIVLGRYGIEKRMMFLIDYGMCRAFAVWEGGVVRIRQSRDRVLFRGTTRYCSVDVHRKVEQGRKDDVWSLVYLLVELVDGSLPWTGKSEPEIGKMKAEMKDEELLKGCPKPWIDIVKHLQDLSYESRPNYRLIYDRFVESILERQETFDTPYDWENKDNTKPSESSVVSKRQPPEKKEGVQRKPPTPTTSVDVPQSAMPPSAIPTVDPAHFSSNDIGL